MLFKRMLYSDVINMNVDYILRAHQAHNLKVAGWNPASLR